MASIRKRGDTYQISVSCGRKPDGTQIIKTTTFRPTETAPTKIKRELDAAVRAFEEKVKNGRSLKGDKLTVNQFVDMWSEQWADTHLSKRTKTDYEKLIDTYFDSSIGQVKLSKVNKLMIAEIVQKMKSDGKSAGTIHKAVSAMSCVFSYAVKMELVDRNPCSCIELPKIEKDDDLHYFTPEQTERFLKAIQEPYTDIYKRNGKTWTQKRSMPLQLQAFFHLALIGGFRLGEQLALTWNDISFDEKRITINKAVSRLSSGEMIVKQPKTKAGIRTVKVTSSCIRLLREWKTEQMKLALMQGSAWNGNRKDFDNNHVFIQNDGSLMSLYTPNQAFERFLKRYNSHCENDADKLPKIRLHDLRHSNVTYLLAEGTDIETVSKRIGHSKPSITMDVYGHCLPEKEDEAALKLEQKFG